MGFHLDFTDKAIEDIAFLKKVNNKALNKKLLKLLEELIEHPFSGIGKPEPLKHQLSGLWSRRINKEHRLIYEVKENTILIISSKGHYEL